MIAGRLRLLSERLHLVVVGGAEEGLAALFADNDILLISIFRFAVTVVFARLEICASLAGQDTANLFLVEILAARQHHHVRIVLLSTFHIEHLGTA